MILIKAIQQFQLREALSTMDEASTTLKRVKNAGFNAIELNGFMIRKNGLMIRLITRLAGMAVGKTGHLDWLKLIKQSGLSVISIHEHLNGILNDTDLVVETALQFGAKYIVITGMHRFDYSDKAAVLNLCEDLDKAGKILKEKNLHLLYHNHNCEFLKVDEKNTAYNIIIENTNPEYVNFEVDSYWMMDAGVDVIKMIKRLGTRMKLHHITDRCVVRKSQSGLILKTDSTELGQGNMDLNALIQMDLQLGVDAVILESHRNWMNHNALESMEISAAFLNGVL